MYHCIMKVQDTKGELIAIGTVVELKEKYLLEEMEDEFNNMRYLFRKEAEEVYTCVMEISGEEEILPVTYAKVSKETVHCLQNVIERFKELYKSTGEGFIKYYKQSEEL